MKSSRTPRLLCILAAAATVCSCVTVTHNEPTQEEMVMAALHAFTAGIEQQDIDRTMSAYSEDYSKSGIGSSKADVRGYFNTLDAQGAFRDTIANLEECEIVVEGERATAGPVHYSSPMGVSSWTYRLKRDADGVWRIVDDMQIR